MDEKSLNPRGDLHRQEESYPLSVRETSADRLDLAEECVQFGGHRLPALTDEDPPKPIAGTTGEQAEHDEPAQHEGDDAQKYRDHPL